jgi:hypothetical protein
MFRQFAVYSRDEHFVEVLTWLRENNINRESHINRTRFWMPKGPLLTEFLLRWGDVCPRVYDDENVQTGYRVPK